VDHRVEFALCAKSHSDFATAFPISIQKSQNDPVLTVLFIKCVNMTQYIRPFVIIARINLRPNTGDLSAGTAEAAGHLKFSSRNKKPLISNCLHHKKLAFFSADTAITA
jgi:hypothetical protein